MGWWTAETGELLGDGPLDVTEDLLRTVSREYLSDHGRKPTMKELLMTLSLVLKYRAGEFTSDAGPKIVTGLVAKTRKGKGDRIRPGTVFSVPLPDGWFGFGRVTPQYCYSEFFDIKSREILPMRMLRKAKLFRFPCLVSLDEIKEGRWKVIGLMPYAEGEFKLQPFRVGNRIDCGYAIVEGFITACSESRPATKEEMDTVPSTSMWNTAMVEQELAKRLSGERGTTAGPADREK